MALILTEDKLRAALHLESGRFINCLTPTTFAGHGIAVNFITDTQYFSICRRSLNPRLTTRINVRRAESVGQENTVSASAYEPRRFAPVRFQTPLTEDVLTAFARTLVVQETKPAAVAT